MCSFYLHIQFSVTLLKSDDLYSGFDTLILDTKNKILIYKLIIKYV
jgi:hypothetical protein